MDVMIDIEGLGQDSNPVVLSIGAVRFDPMAVGKVWPKGLSVLRAPDADFHDADWFHVNITIDSAIKAGLSVSGDTIAWWLGAKKDSPGEEARKALFNPVPVNIRDAAAELRRFVSGCDRIWAMPITYDIACLRAMYGAIAQRVPWKASMVMDLGTYSNNVPRAETNVAFYGVEHHPVWDACRQASRVIQVSHWKESWRRKANGY